MGEWWERPYAGAPPQREIKGFPRPLYDPSAKEYGKTPSARGPDVIALKRTLCRLGRWGTWDPAKWDDGYWTEFAHGTPGHDILNSGIAGFQYQQHIDATGWVGAKTFNSLCYALIPDAPGFMHPGEHAMDAVAVDMINEAWEMFAGTEPPPPETKTLRQKALERAKTQIGYVEKAGNDNKYGSWYGLNYQPYCAIGVTWCFENEGNSPAFDRGSRYAYVPYLLADARDGKNGLKTVGADSVWPGDLVCYDFEWDGEFDHVGIFEKWKGGNTFQTVEFNTSPEGSGGSQSNGGGVYRRTRTVGYQGTVFVRVAEP